MGSIADDIINGDIDQYTGKWLGEGDGFPRSVGKTYYTNGKKSSPPMNKTYAWIKDMLKANTSLAKSLDNKQAVIIFIKKFYASEDLIVIDGTSWKYFKDITEHKKAFKQFIKEYKILK